MMYRDYEKCKAVYFTDKEMKTLRKIVLSYLRRTDICMDDEILCTILCLIVEKLEEAEREKQADTILEENGDEQDAVSV